jgi:hypothetical protein
MPASRPSPRPVALRLALRLAPRLALCLALAGGASPGRALAQAAPPVAADSTGPARVGWLVGASIGLPGAGGEAAPSLFTVGAHVTQLRPGRPGVDLAVGTVPRALAEGVVALGARAGVGLPLALSRGVLVLPSAGASLLGGVGAGGVGGTAGLHAGVAAVVLPASTVGLRAGVTWHRFEETGGGLWLLEVGFVRGLRAR